MDKLDLISAKLGKIVISIKGSNIMVPDTVQILSASPKYAYVNNEATDEVLKIALNVIDIKTATVAAQVGLDLSSLPPVYAEIQNETLVKQLQNQLDKLVGKQVSTSGAQIALRWVGFGDRGRWGGLKLILNDLKSTPVTH